MTWPPDAKPSMEVDTAPFCEGLDAPPPLTEEQAIAIRQIIERDLETNPHAREVFEREARRIRAEVEASRKEAS